MLGHTCSEKGRMRRRRLAPPAAAVILSAASAFAAEEAKQSPAVAQSPAAQPPAAQEQVTKEEATNVLGQKVMGQGGEDIGRIVDVLVDDQGKPRAAVVDFGGFMGVGSRKIAVAWRALRFAPAQQGGRRITLDMTPDQIKATPDYTPSGKPVSVATPPPAATAPAAAEPAVEPQPPPPDQAQPEPR
jgi:PRC-barrel domain